MVRFLPYAKVGNLLLCFMTSASCLPSVNLRKELGPFVFVIFSSALKESRQGLEAKKILKSSVPMISWKGEMWGTPSAKGVQPLIHLSSEYDRADSWGTDSHPVVLVIGLLLGDHVL